MLSKTIFLAFALIFIFAPISSATYISGTIFIEESGNAILDIQTDVPIELNGVEFSENKLRGSTQSLTSKEEDVWTFSLALGNYDTILLDIVLPENTATIKGIGGSASIFDTETKTLSVIDEGKLDVTIQYTLKEKGDLSLFFWPIVLLIIIAGIITFTRYKSKKDRIKHIMPIINENEQKIIDYLIKHGQTRQKQLREHLKIPKASFTRYLLNLEKKHLTERDGDGKNKIVKLK